MISRFALLFLVFSSPLLHADVPVQWAGTSQISFSGTSTLHGWAGKVAANPFAATVTFNDAGQPVAVKAVVTVDAVKMDTAEPKRDANMHKAMNVTAHPLVTAAINTPFTEIAPGGGPPARLPMTLTVLGRPQPVKAVLTGWRLTGDKATFDLDFELSLKSCGITVPSVMMVIRVGDTVKVRASVVLTKS